VFDFRTQSGQREVDLIVERDDQRIVAVVLTTGKYAYRAAAASE